MWCLIQKVPMEVNSRRGEVQMENIIISGFADEIDPNLDKQIEVVKRLGISYIEMRGVNGKGLVEYSLDDVREIKKILDTNCLLYTSRCV